MRNYRSQICKTVGCPVPLAEPGYCHEHRTADTRGKHATIEYDAWARMKARCLRPSHEAYINYGARGITVCERWLNSFADFLADMGQKPEPDLTLERRDVNGDYSPSNCYWAGRDVQSINRRLMKNNTSGYRGVIRRRTKWRTRITLRGVQHQLGYFNTAEEAAHTYDRAAIRLHGDLAHLNFP